MSSPKTWNFIYANLERGIPVMLLYVLESEGSSPGRQGFFMAVNALNEMEGSIGGGIMEHKFVELAKEKMQEWSAGKKQSLVKKQVHSKNASANQSGMICSGEQEIFIYLLDEKDEPTISRITKELSENRNGTLMLTPGTISYSETVPEQDHEFYFLSETDWWYREKTGPKNHLHIIGGGHCALALSRLMRSMDFYIHVYDDRKELKTMIENEAAHEKTLVSNYESLRGIIPAGPNQYIVIMTFGYRTDDIAVRSLMDKEFSYLGLLGSRSKIEKMFGEYRKEGINDEWLQRIEAPAGLAIRSRTPTEIAVSIAASIIQEKNKALK